MHIFGLTGKTGAGKSTVANALSKKGFFVIDGDKAARQVTEKGSPILLLLKEEFGSDILSQDGELIRPVLAKKAFSNKQSTEKLNKITHGAIDALFKKTIEEQSKNGFENFLIDAAALLESPSAKLCQKMIVVTAPEELRLERIMKRDNISREDAMRRINAQRSDEYYLSAADIIIRNYPPYNIEEELSKLSLD